MQGRAGSDRIRVWHRARRHGEIGRAPRSLGFRLGLSLGLSLGLGLAVGGAAVEVDAAPVRATGKAQASETKSASLAKTRARALRRARRAALEAALRQVSGPVDPAARKAVLDAADAWTGAYRVLSERGDGQDVELELEVEIDLVRLTKRVGKREGTKPVFRLGDVGAAEGCGDAEALAGVVRAELGGQGGVALDGKAPLLDVALDCRDLGAVEHTYMHAVQVRVTATADGRTVADVSTPAFAATPAEALAAAVQRALTDASTALVARRSGQLRVRVQSPLPAARIRRLETAMRNSVLGVDEVEVGTLSSGVVELHVRGGLSAKTLARGLGGLVLPGFSLTIVRVEPPDVVTIRLQ